MKSIQRKLWKSFKKINSVFSHFILQINFFSCKKYVRFGAFCGKICDSKSFDWEKVENSLKKVPKNVILWNFIRIRLVDPFWRVVWYVNVEKILILSGQVWREASLLSVVMRTKNLWSWWFIGWIVSSQSFLLLLDMNISLIWHFVYTGIECEQELGQPEAECGTTHFTCGVQYWQFWSIRNESRVCCYVMSLGWNWNGVMRWCKSLVVDFMYFYYFLYNIE